ncbi:MAG: hypothetical protein PWP31_1137 [Clostridia bacterium]|nr:hypothetical protein [Clostridia bacterium]
MPILVVFFGFRSVLFKLGGGDAMPPLEKLFSKIANLKDYLCAWLARWAEIEENKRKKIVITSFIAVFILITGCYKLFATNAWAVSIDGERIVISDSRDKIEQAIENILDKHNAQKFQNLCVAGQLDYQRVRASETQIVAQEQQLEKILESKIKIVASATAIKINNKPKVFVKDNKTAEAVIEKLKQAYTPADKNIELKEVKIQERISFENCQVEPQKVVKQEEALSILKGVEYSKGSDYIVKPGDSLWSIAREHDLLVDDIRLANPNLDGDFLDIGQKIVLMDPTPLLHVVVSYKEEVKEDIPYEIKVEKSDNYFRGFEKVIQAGSEGEQLVTYQVVAQNGIELKREVLQEKVIKEPVTKIIQRGTRITVASYRGGSGRLAWPLRGYITSYYGYRGSEFHTGLDIAGSIGEPIYAAESGTVTYVGYNGGYGRLICIDHGGGLVTRYAHLSGYNVKRGQEVNKGQVIGYVGISGRTTGPHLHFEVRVNGVHRNPSNYLK